MEQSIQNKLENVELEYKRNKQKLEESIEETLDEKRRFDYQLDETADQLRIIAQREDYIESDVSINSAYQMIQSAQEEGTWIVRNEINKIETEIEEQQRVFNQEMDHYEEELRIARRERMEKDND